MSKELIENSARLNAYEFIRQKQIPKQYLLSHSQITVKATITSTLRKSQRDFMGILYFVTSKTNFAGVRFWFSCPECGRRITDYYATFYRPEYLCRYCHNLAYSSQNRHREKMWECYNKYEQKLEKIKKKLDNKWLRNPAKERLLAQYKELSYRRNYIFSQYLNHFVRR